MDNLPPTILQPTDEKSRRGFLYGGLANTIISAIALSLFGCNPTKDNLYRQSTPASIEQNINENRIGLEEFVNGLPKNSRVLIGYNRWDSTPGPNEADKLTPPTREVLEQELLYADKSKNSERADSIRRVLNLTALLERDKIDRYVTNNSKDNPLKSYFTLDYRATHIVSTGFELTKDQARELSNAHRYAGINNPTSPTQKTPSKVEAYNYLNFKELEKLTEK